nr:restriction endonuclease subunit S [Pedobacter sp. ASV2]
MGKLFSEILDFKPKSKFPASEGLDNAAFPFYTSSTKQTKFINNKLYDGEAIIIGTGGLPSIHFESKGFSTSTDCLVVTLKNDVDYNLKFIYYFLYGNMHVLAKGFKGVGLKHISKNYINSIEIPELSIDEQLNYVNNFDKIQGLINNRTKMLQVLDELTKSKFIEMFGQDFEDKKIWDLKPLKDLIIDIQSGWSPICENYPRKNETEWAVLKQGAITKREFIPSENKQLPKEIETNRGKMITADKDDLLISRKNTKDLVGSAVYIHDHHNKLLIPDTVFKLNYIREKVSGIYLAHLLNDNNFRKKLRRLASGAASSMVNISQSKLKSLKIPIPKNEKLQFKFEEYSIKGSLQKDLLLKSLNLLEELFKTLTFKAFNDKSNDLLDEIDALIEDEIELELFLDNFTEGNFENEDIYKNDADKLYKILEKTEIGNIADKGFRKGIIQRLEENKIIIELNKIYKNRILDETATT